MKILLINYRYFVSGGPEKYLFNVKRELEARGHEVIPFSTKSSKNVETPYAKYFVDAIGGSDATYYEDYKKTPKVIGQMISRSFYSLSVKRAVQTMIDAEKPDLVYVLHFVNKLSPSVLRAAKSRKLPVVLRLSDYLLLCPRFDFLRGTQPCEECLTGGLGACVKHRCVKGSLSASLIRVWSMRFHKLIHIYNDVDAFVTPSAFLAKKLEQGGFPKDKLHHIPTFTQLGEPPVSEKVGAYGLYFGRLTKEKGIDALLEAYAKMPERELVIAGDDATPEGAAYKKLAAEKGMRNVRFTGFLSGEDMREVVRKARFVLIPSIWYDNLPNTALEAFCCGKPVLASDVGSLPELVTDGENGLLFAPGDADSLAKAVRAMDDDAKVAEMGARARRCAEERYAPDKHLNALLGLFESLIRKKRGAK